MSDLLCMKCGAKGSHADAMIGDAQRDCGVSAEPANMNGDGRYGGEKHQWTDADTVDLSNIPDESRHEIDRGSEGVY